MDADDICRSDRFTQQLCFLNDHPDYGVVGSWSEDIGVRGETYTDRSRSSSDARGIPVLNRNRRAVDLPPCGNVPPRYRSFRRRLPRRFPALRRSGPVAAPLFGDPARQHS
ncbi:hypothetical protein [Novosphingobium panipatense]|uniref:hypothetical protein n=1 Tax=Novosphingobium panipatense TaxID=428991 RepID=UPI00360F1838